ncbi:hypothetical protein [Actinocrispum sp. NPDC049592]|uniref:hypothetical protein n=1 Tax=Actinocrispum sp. NPDC049592 TaxID=3154835 RepID=UPI0034384AC2
MSSAAVVGTVVREGDYVQCYLCERWFRSVTAHLPSHGWDHLAYREAFGLERGVSLEGMATRQRRERAFRVRRDADPVLRAGGEQGRALARSGALTKAAADASRGRPQPEQRRRKTLQTLAATSPEARAEGRRRQVADQLRQTAAEAATRLGFADIGSLVRDRVAAGASLAAISREAGLHKDWMCRNLSTVDPEAARFAEASPAGRVWDAPWLPKLEKLGFADVASYLTDRHVVRSCTVRAIAAEIGASRNAVESALARHGLQQTAHATKRKVRDERAAALASRFGFPGIDSYLADRRAAGMSWRAIARESGQPETWIRRRAGVSA